MSVLVNLNLSPQEACDDNVIRREATRSAKVSNSRVSSFRIIKRSIDARQRSIRVNLSVELLLDNDMSYSIEPFHARNVADCPEVIIVGAGPAGLFAGLRLIELGLRPVILERGKDVSSRKKDVAQLCRAQIVNPDSNYCFGEGGAGTFSDGKLFTRSKKRGDNSRVLELFCLHGADNSILYEAHPHLGTDKLPHIISSIRETIIASGGVVLFNTKVDDFIIKGSSIEGVISGSEVYKGVAVILSTGHSSREIFDLCRRRNIDIEAKSFAMGVRVEHPQEHIDMLRYHGSSRGDYLPAASYNIVRQVNGRGVYSFCMCPGGFIVPSATIQEGVVVNGMSPSKRNSVFANSGIVVELRMEDFPDAEKYGAYAGLEFQKQLETMAWEHSNKTQMAPAQRLADFVAGKNSGSLPKVSYIPGVTSSPMHEWLPKGIGDRLREGFRLFDMSMRGFVTNEAVILGVESRTSSPVRIPRKETLEHISVDNLYPCGEGSGYAGGIVSSAVDGMRAAEEIAKKYNS